MCAAGRKKGLRFKTRNYKHEVGLDGGGRRRSILTYTDEVWETICRNVAGCGFTGLVLYTAYHPFEFILDYSGFPGAATQPARKRTAVRKALNRGLAIAHRHGLKTFMQHYITHFTEPLAKHLGIPTTGRLANIDHPELIRYQRWCYREIFRQCPDLDGLYFNFESANNAYDQLLRTSVVEFNRMKKKPIAVYRLWGANDPKGIRSLVKAYAGKSILGHKISDSNDTYYLPVADSRVTEWKRHLPDTEFMFLIGPCHNCGTNLCQEMWGDYDFVQEMLRDAEKKGADSISFHTIAEFFSPDVETKGIFSDDELARARYNVLHFDAVVDYFHGRRKTRRERAACLAERTGVGLKAGRHLLDAVTASSQLILLTHQQFCSGSALDGYLNPGRFSHIQDPFYYYPATELNHQATKLMWQLVRSDSSWLKKRMDTTVAPDDMLQYLIDYVDPSKPGARQDPKKMAGLLKKNIGASFTALARFRKVAGKRQADRLATYVRRNAAVGEFVRREILAAIQLYGIYFARTKRAVISRLRNGLVEYEALRAAVRMKPQKSAHVRRAMLLDRFEPDRPIKLLRQVLRAVERTDFPMAAYRDYLASRREYNEIRRVLRAMRCHNRKSVGYAVKQLKAAITHATDSLAALDAPRHRKLAANVRAWLDFLEMELGRTKPPKAVCPKTPGAWLSMFWDHAFRAGEHFAEDFLGFFRKMSLQPESTLSFRIWRTSKEFVVAMREENIDVKQRKRQWKKYQGSGSDSFVERIYVDVEGRGRERQMFIVWPGGETVSAGKRPNVNARTKFSGDAASYTVTTRLPWSLVGRRPKKGEVWGVNVTANPSIERNREFTWAPQYDASSGNPILFGKIRFE
ncbi:MAG: hypothetical protein AMK75_01945 [Planctomycetes bacterium SM23_65]|nr:MAG: hypothetical protein AMK75_01945 [Planctomycetes bacterium SM23_65]